MSTVASSNSDLTINADGSGSDIKFQSNSTERMRLTSVGRLGVGTAAPDQLLTLQEGGDSQISLKNSSGTTSGYIGTAGGFGSAGTDDLRIRCDSSNIVFGFSGTEKMRLTSNGRLGVGTASLSNKFQVEEDSTSNWVASYHDSRTDAHSSAGMIAFSRTSSYTGVGSITTSESSTAFNTSSDYRLKENLVGLDGALDRLAQLKTYRFNFKADPETAVDGFVAHEVADVVPEAVTGEKDAMETVQIPVEGGDPDEPVETREVERIKPQGIDQSKLVPLLVASVQELSAKVSSLEEQLEQLNAS